MLCPFFYAKTAYFIVSPAKEVIMMSDGGYGHGFNFALIVVLFILLIIVGTSYMSGYGY